MKHKLKKGFIANTFHLCQFRDGFYLKSHKQSKNACNKPNTVHLLRILKQTNYEDEQHKTSIYNRLLCLFKKTNYYL